MLKSGDILIMTASEAFYFSRLFSFIFS